jgi:hypothetical protein
VLTTVFSRSMRIVAQVVLQLPRRCRAGLAAAVNKSLAGGSTRPGFCLHSGCIARLPRTLRASGLEKCVERTRRRPASFIEAKRPALICLYRVPMLSRVSAATSPSVKARCSAGEIGGIVQCGVITVLRECSTRTVQALERRCLSPFDGCQPNFLICDADQVR